MEWCSCKHTIQSI